MAIDLDREADSFVLVGKLAENCTIKTFPAADYRIVLLTWGITEYEFHFIAF
jgi:hypothetical protein